MAYKYIFKHVKQLKLKYHACEQGPIYVPGVRNNFLLIKLKVLPRKLRNILVKFRIIGHRLPIVINSEWSIWQSHEKAMKRFVI